MKDAVEKLVLRVGRMLAVTSLHTSSSSLVVVLQM
jgi:hypothetical protein